MNTRRGLRRLGAVGAALAFFLVMGAWKGLQYRDVLHVEYRGGEIESFYLDTGRDEDTGRDTVADCFTWDSGEPLVNTEACPDVLSGKVETFPPVPLQFPIGTLVWALIGLPLFFGVRGAIRGFGAGPDLCSNCRLPLNGPGNLDLDHPPYVFCLHVRAPEDEDMLKTTLYRLLFGVAVLTALAAGSCKHAVLPTPNQPALGDPLPGLSQAELAQFKAGQAVFARVFTPATGLGPQFNSVSCASCHQQPVLGGEGDAGEPEDSEMHATRQQADGSCDMLMDKDGPVFRKQTTDGSAPRHPPVDAQLGQRNTPPVFGLGLLDAVVQTKAHVPPVGRFGRKAQEATLAAFTKGAFATEQGIDVPSELSQADLDAAVTFLRFLAPPARLPLDAQAKHGERLFSRVGCATCHTPKMRTGQSQTSALARQDVFAFTDLQVHRMGPRLTDVCFFNAAADEFRTAPLWGTRFRKTLLHDGRAATVPDAVAFHGGEAAQARTLFQALSPKDQAALVAFLNKI
ncbi:MAG TPA: di-heme oxidoredictase family protein [Methylomirabilota bacterium]|nr:di-heme oxidoredictase family protein [Methylomirabilota bacterium]